MSEVAESAPTGSLPVVKARFYPATGQAIALDASLTPAAGRGVVMLSVAGEISPRRVSVADLSASERFRRATRSVQLADGSVLEVDDGAQLSQVLTVAGKPDAMVTRWQHSWRAVAISLVLSIVAAVVGYIWVLPAAADKLAARVPPSWASALDQIVLGQMKESDTLKTTELSEARQQQLRERFSAAIASAEATDQTRPAPSVNVYFFRIGDMPNAFALPGGSIVFLDGIVKLAPNDDALVGVFAHEYGHVKHRHGLRTLLRTAAVSAVAGWYFGDFTSLANAAILVSQLSYSRSFENQADDTAVELLRSNKLDTRPLAELFRRMRDRSVTKDDDTKKEDAKPVETASPMPDAGKSENAGKPRREKFGALSVPEFLSTHPDIDQRIERFEKAATP